MKRLLLLLSVLLVGTSWIVAQDSSTQNQNSDPVGQSTASGETTVQGCLNGANGGFTLTDEQGNSYQLTGDTAKLSEHVGHQVKVTGTAESASSPHAGGTAARTSGDGASRTLQVNSVKHISKNCESGSVPK